MKLQHAHGEKFECESFGKLDNEAIIDKINNIKGRRAKWDLKQKKNVWGDQSSMTLNILFTIVILNYYFFIAMANMQVLYAVKYFYMPRNKSNGNPISCSSRDCDLRNGQKNSIVKIYIRMCHHHTQKLRLSGLYVNPPTHVLVSVSPSMMIF